MKDIILIGSGGCMRELAWQILEQNRTQPKWNIIGYVDEVQSEQKILVGREKIPYLGNDDYLLNMTTDTNVVVSVGTSKLRKKIVEKLKKNPYLLFPNIILSSACVCEDVMLGQGCIISMDCRISTNSRLGDFVFMNIGSKICHDGNIADFVTLSPDVTLAGAVQINENTDIGMGAKVIQGMQIGANVIVGAGSVVVTNIEDNCTIAGVPAKRI